MRFLGFLFVVLIVAAGVAFFTKPSEADAEAALRKYLTMAAAREELGDGRSTAQNLALAACKLSLNDCYDLVRTGIETEFTDKTLFVQFHIEGFDRVATCYGAFTQFVCPGGLKKS
ncbi:hypothetical protein N9C96_02280 [bacterium]|nr:hypothetical protein [bacterium]